ncbi:MAG TPA: squalene/phytoene synthase family protein [Steroidobacteraceae bacterium]|nr:squalene/phytoene synthase family protein [Steroidobacteraceae bacterium]
MSPRPPLLEEPYRSAALPPGTTRYLSWLFAAPQAKDPLLGVLALECEWRALTRRDTEPTVLHAKLGWWQQEIERLIAHRPVHPITRFLRALPGAESVSFAPFERTLGAVSRELGEAWTTLAELETQADALHGEPLRVVAALVHAGAPLGVGASAGLSDSISALATGRYIAHAAAVGGDHERARGQAAERLARVPLALPAEIASAERHLPVMAALEHKHLYAPKRDGARAGVREGVSDLLSAWRAARRAARRAGAHGGD